MFNVVESTLLGYLEPASDVPRGRETREEENPRGWCRIPSIVHAVVFRCSRFGPST